MGLSLCQEAQRVTVPYSLCSHQETSKYVTATIVPSITSPRSFFLLFRIKWLHCCLVARAHGRKHSSKEIYNLLGGVIPILITVVRLCAALLFKPLLQHHHHQHVFCAYSSSCKLKQRYCLALMVLTKRLSKMNIRRHAFRKNIY